MNKRLALLFLFFSFAFSGQAQIKLSGDTTDIDFTSPKEYKIGGVVVEGAEHLDNGVLILLTGLGLGDKVQVPGERFSTAISNLWKQGLFEDISFTGKVVGDEIFITL